MAIKLARKNNPDNYREGLLKLNPARIVHLRDADRMSTKSLMALMEARINWQAVELNPVDGELGLLVVVEHIDENGCVSNDSLTAAVAVPHVDESQYPKGYAVHFRCGAITLKQWVESLLKGNGNGLPGTRAARQTDPRVWGFTVQPSPPDCDITGYKDDILMLMGKLADKLRVWISGNNPGITDSEENKIRSLIGLPSQ